MSAFILTPKVNIPLNGGNENLKKWTNFHCKLTFRTFTV